MYRLDDDNRHTLRGSFENHELLIQAWGTDSVRVRAAADQIRDGLPGALDPGLLTDARHGSVHAEVRPDGSATLVNRRLTVEAAADGRLRFLRTGTDRELLADHLPYVHTPGPRVFAALDDGTYRLEQHFAAYDGERIHGLGQHLHGRLDQKGLVIDLAQRNAEVTIPFLASSQGYGLLWNNPAFGRVELGGDRTRWVADSAHQIDYWITAGDTPAQIMHRYADVTGHPPLLPTWATGFWQSKLRYRTQDELLTVAREYARRELPLSMIIADFFHWPAMGDWRFEKEEWPDPAAMAAELRDLPTPDGRGVGLAVSVWPTLEKSSENYTAFRDAGLLVRDAHGGVLTNYWPARGGGYEPMAYYDATDPAARAALWRQLSENYLANGVTAFWLDSAEPDLPPHLAVRAQYAAGPAQQVGNMYGYHVAQGAAEGLAASGVPDSRRPLNLIRSAWAGSQRYGAALWSGDISTTFESLATQIRAGLNVAMSGIPWWNTDIGGFYGGNPDDPAYRELVIRWFQYGTFSPIMRLHGDREPNQPFGAAMTGGPNEVWSYGEEAYAIMREHLLLRERLRPYLAELSEAAHEAGAPAMRPLFFEFPDDPRAWEVDDQFLLGPDVLVAPVAAAGARRRPVYLPAGAVWQDAATGVEHQGGTQVDADAPLERIPVFVRGGAAVGEALAAYGAMAGTQSI
jgi:alpha-D-xyloside xylohydrolase